MFYFFHRTSIDGVWFNHGEEINVENKTNTFDVYELFKMIHYEDEDFLNQDFFDDDKDDVDSRRKEDELVKNLEDAETPLYPGCTDHTKLSAITVLYNLKCETALSDSGFDKLLAVQHLFLPKDNVLPKTLYEVKKFLKAFDMGFEKIMLVRIIVAFSEKNTKI